MLTMGLEKEFFVTNAAGELVLVPSHVPMDECGILAEARGDAFTNITDAVYSLLAYEHRINVQLYAENLKSLVSPVEKVSRELRHLAARRNGKGVASYQNLYGFTRHRHAVMENTAGIHISFTLPFKQTCTCRECGKGTMKAETNQIFDYVQLFRGLDLAFKDEIRASKRNPGFYEIKSDGRIEYRSLPNDVSMDKVISIVDALVRNI